MDRIITAKCGEMIEILFICNEHNKGSIYRTQLHNCSSVIEFEAKLKQELEKGNEELRIENQKLREAIKRCQGLTNGDLEPNLT